ncbi:MAG: DUF484 family protein [Gammaproteobacteria bacterium]|nr:DUF484 family protein [Gammaproteobacteria bacterium]
MSTQRKPEYLVDELSDTVVHDYLESHPDFFERHPNLLRAMQLPHASGDAVSLVERQVSMLRQKELKLERQLKELIAVARDNDVLAAKIHELTLQLLSASDLGGTIVAIEEAVRAGFNADQAVIILFGDPDAFRDIDAGRFFRAVTRDDAALKPFATFLDSKNPRCGRVRNSQLEFLFRDDAGDIGSLALIPLEARSEIGFLAIGSADADRFHPGMSIDFLARVGDLVAAALKRF